MIMRVTIECEDKIFDELSALDKKCVGSDGWSAESFKSEVRKPNGIVFCIIQNQRIIGLISGYFAEGEGDITSVAVAPEHRRKGLATALIKEIIKSLPENTENIFLEVRESNFSAMALYEKCGFEKLSVRKNFYINPCENAVVMVKKTGNNMYSEIPFPDKTILEISFLDTDDFYTISIENNNYTIIGGDKDIKTNLIGIGEDKKVYYILADYKNICYISANINTFIKQLLLFDDYVNKNNLPENPADSQLYEFAECFRKLIINSDVNAFYDKSTFWSEICEEIEYGIII
ncbi:MAG: ribosomal protein S18-alanine N-acetyltransferase [Ruminococcus sp.]|nr:ribosomal protein S18-alanine N-acetyltransferase [Ruminococcus sp.]